MQPRHTRALAPADAGAVARLWLAGSLESGEVHGGFRPRASVEEYAASVAADLQAGAFLGWGVFEGDPQRLLGYLTARVVAGSEDFVQPPYLYVLDLDVAADSRRSGVGSALVAQARSHCAQQALASMEASWLTGDPRAAGFWRRHGFEPYLSRGRAAP